MAAGSITRFLVKAAAIPTVLSQRRGCSESKLLMKNIVETEPVSAARRVLVELETRLEVERKQQDVLATKRRPLAWRAQTGDTDARCDLDSLSEEEHTLDGDIRDLGLAMDEARERLAAADGAPLGNGTPSFWRKSASADTNTVPSNTCTSKALTYSD
jgi:hypothetical protein